MAIKKTELYSSLWTSCDELRGGMDASQYKDFVLTLLFMKYVSDKYKGDPYGMIVVPKGASFDDMVALKGDKEIGDKVNKIISALAEENDLKGVIDLADFNDEDKLGKGKDMVDRLTKLIGTFEGLDMSSNRADGDDLLGDAYEYLMRHFATESGKSKGQFYTPSEVSRILAKVIGITEDTAQDATVYDPTCGSGSLLLKASDEAPRGLSIFGQENEGPTAALARMNMILHNNATAKIWKGNTISDPQWKDGAGQLKTFDFAVANPPFSNKNWTSGINPEEDEFKRFSWGVPPEKNGDYTFLLHIIKSLKNTGKGAVILPHGVLFRGNAEARIRENLIKQGYIKAIIGLPANLFYGTGIPACIIVIDKAGAAQRKGIYMVDASKGFIKDGNKNRLRSQDIHRIVDVFSKQTEQPRYARTVPQTEIVKNDYNLNIPRYIDASEPEDLHDLSAHLQGGIPQRDIDALEHYWQVFPSIRATLFAPLKDKKRPGYSKGLVAASQVKSTILNHEEFKTFATLSLKPFTAWAKRAALADITVGELPKDIIHRISEDLLKSYGKSALLSKYNIYQLLMDYWAEVMQDDVYVISQDGWEAGNLLRILLPTKDSKGKDVYKETPDFVMNKKRYKGELISTELVISRYFQKEQQQIDSLVVDLESVRSEMQQLLEDHGGEEQALAELKEGDKKPSKTDISLCIAEGEGTVVNQLNRALAKKVTDVDGQLEKTIADLQKCEGLPEYLAFYQPLLSSKGTLTKGSVSKRLKAIEGDEEGGEFLALKKFLDITDDLASGKKTKKLLLVERAEYLSKVIVTDKDDESVANLLITHQYLEFTEKEAHFNSQIRAAEKELFLLLIDKYPVIPQEEIKTLIVQDKWLATLKGSVKAEIDRVTQQMANRVKELEERYAEPLPDIESSVQALSDKVAGHLKAMGLTV